MVLLIDIVLLCHSSSAASDQAAHDFSRHGWGSGGKLTYHLTAVHAKIIDYSDI